MTIEEAIKHCKDKAEKYGELIITNCEDGREFYNPVAEECAEEHEQLAHWLEELQEWRKLKLICANEGIIVFKIKEANNE